MAKICPKCGGTQVDCEVCHLPPRRIKPLARPGVVAATYSIVFPLIRKILVPTFEVQGIDISAWNGVMNFNITKTKCQTAYPRLGYGNEWKDNRCDTYRTDLITVDMPYGPYWFIKAGQNWEMHAESFAEIAAEFPYQLHLWMDCEYTILDPANTLDWLIRCHDRIIRLTNVVPGVYSSAGWWNAHVAYSTYWDEVKKWVANWTSAPAPYMPNGWTWALDTDWQWSADNNGKAKEYGMVSGGDPDMDLNRWYGTVTQFNDIHDTHILPIGIIPPGELPEKIYVNTGSLNIRREPNPYNSEYIIGSTRMNAEWKPYGWVIGADNKEWWKINEYAYIAKWLTRQ